MKIHSSIENRLVNLEFDNNTKIVKKAMDSRRIDQEHIYNPRRGIQYYTRSEPFIDDKLAAKIKLCFKVKTAADLIKDDFDGDPDWFDSRTRILCNSLDNTLRTEQKDYDFSQRQFDYLDELLYMRYRLKEEDISKMSEQELKQIILNKDEKLSHKQIFANYNNSSKFEKLSQDPVKVVQNIMQKPEDSLIEKLFGGVKASKETKNVKRSITITIDDSINDPVEEKKSGIEET